MSDIGDPELVALIQQAEKIFENKGVACAIVVATSEHHAFGMQFESNVVLQHEDGEHMQILIEKDTSVFDVQRDVQRMNGLSNGLTTLLQSSQDTQKALIEVAREDGNLLRQIAELQRRGVDLENPQAKGNN